MRRPVPLLALLFLLPFLRSAAATPDEPLTVKRIFEGPPLTRPLPDWEWRPGTSELVRVSHRDDRRVFVALDPVTGAERDLLDLTALDSMVEGPGIPCRGIGRSGPADLLWGPTSDVLFVVVKGDVVRVDLRTGEKRRVTRTKSPMSDLQVSPDGEWVSFSRDNDLWIARATGEGIEERRLTTGGSEDLLNATLDWVYPEELDLKTAAWWSPDSKRIAFLQLDETGVTKYPLLSYEARTGGLEYVRYPKAGDRNPVARLGVVPVPGGSPVWMSLGSPPDEYVARVAWFPGAEHVAAVTLDRSQRRLSIRRCDAGTGTSTRIWEETDEAWIDVPPAPRFLDDDRFDWRSARGGWRHWVRIDVGAGAARSVALTPERIDADDLVAHEDGRASSVFRAEGRILRWSPGDAGPAFPPYADDPGGTVSASLDASRRHALVETSSATKPPRLEVRRTVDGVVVRVLGDASTPRLDAMPLAVPEFGTIETPDGPLPWRLWKPVDLGRDPGKTYGVIVRVYGGPGSRLVRDSWGRGPLLETLLTQHGFLVFEIDGRGTGGRGSRLERLVRGRLGILELEDQVKGIEMLKQRPYVEATRVGIWGWSYGGTMVVNALCRRSDVFKVGVAVAPVTDWRLYDTIYTERYMGLPSENAKGYDEASCLKHAAGMDGKLLLMHGTADDNVHVQNTLQMVEALVQAEKTGFEVMLYPDVGHGMGGNQVDLFTRLVDFFDRHLGSR